MTKIVGTLGPKSRSVDTISSCLKAGMSGNFSLSCLLLFSPHGYLLSQSHHNLPSFVMHNINKTHVCYNSGALAVARFDFSWGDAAYHQETLENLKLAIKSTKKLCAVSDPTPSSFVSTLLLVLPHVYISVTA
jgi:pyruvate kinase